LNARWLCSQLPGTSPRILPSRRSCQAIHNGAQANGRTFILSIILFLEIRHNEYKNDIFVNGFFELVNFMDSLEGCYNPEE
jgi:hypothetical protein